MDPRLGIPRTHQNNNRLNATKTHPNSSPSLNVPSPSRSVRRRDVGAVRETPARRGCPGRTVGRVTPVIPADAGIQNRQSTPFHVIPSTAGASVGGMPYQCGGAEPGSPPPNYERNNGETSAGQTGPHSTFIPCDILRINTPRMIPLIANHADELAEICRRHHVKRLDVFGSAAVGDFNPDKSDIDFLVQIQPLPPRKHADAYFGLLNDLQSIFGRSIDLVEDKAIENPYFRATVDETREPVYGH